MAKLKFRNGYQDLGAYPLLKDVVERGDLFAEEGSSSGYTFIGEYDVYDSQTQSANYIQVPATYNIIEGYFSGVAGENGQDSFSGYIEMQLFYNNGTTDVALVNADFLGSVTQVGIVSTDPSTIHDSTLYTIAGYGGVSLPLNSDTADSLTSPDTSNGHFTLYNNVYPSGQASRTIEATTITTRKFSDNTVYHIEAKLYATTFVSPIVKFRILGTYLSQGKVRLYGIK